MVIHYLGHSGFWVETEENLLLFDYFRGDLAPLKEKAKEKPLRVFASHAHKDHFNPEIFSFMEDGRDVRYLLSFDIKGDPQVPQDADVQYLDANETYEIEGLGTVRTLRSTDLGVAFLVITNGGTFYHAGDLNFWDWEGEPKEWLAKQESVYKQEIGKLAGIPIDAAFVVLDDRLEGNFAEGLRYFLSECSARYILPMHYWKDTSVVERCRELPEAKAFAGRILDTVHEKEWKI